MSKRLRFEVAVLLLLVGALVGSRAAQYGRAYDFFDPLVDIHHEISRHYVEEPPMEAMRAGAIRGMLTELNDPYTDYLSPRVLENFDEQTKAQFSGIGAEIHAEGDYVVIVTPLEGSPALEAGVKAGDVILEINGESGFRMNVPEAQDKIKGPAGTEVNLKLRRGADEEIELTIVRGRIQIQTVKGFRRAADQHWNYMLDEENKIAYIRVTQFSDPTTTELRDAVEVAKTQGMKGLILDMRFNPGGLLNQAVDIADLFLSEGRIVSSKGRNRAEQVHEADAGDDVGEFPMIVLINESSASASEIVAGALKDNGRALILGTRSYGKGSVQEIHGLAGGEGAIKVTTAWYYLPSGRNLHRKEGADEWGVDPNDGYYVPMTGDEVEEMLKRRTDSDVLRDSNGGSPGPVNAETLARDLADPQLTAAYTTMLAKLNDGAFKPVGQPNATLLAHLSEKAALEAARVRQVEQLEEIDRRLESIQAKISNGEAPPAEVEAEVEAENTQ